MARQALISWPSVRSNHLWLVRLAAVCVVASAWVQPLQSLSLPDDRESAPFQRELDRGSDQTAIDLGGSGQQISVRAARRVRWQSIFVYGLPAARPTTAPFIRVSNATTPPYDKLWTGIYPSSRQGRAPPRA